MWNAPHGRTIRAWLLALLCGVVAAAGLPPAVAAEAGADVATEADVADEAILAAHPSLLPGGTSLLDIPYATVGDRTLRLDLHLPPDDGTPSPLVIYLHGGAWRAGDKAEVPAFLIQRGYAVASLDFRSSEEARFPANVHDIKAGIRFLRAHAQRHGYRADRIAISGSSSGGHLAALVGVTNGHPELEGEVGEHTGESSSVQAIITWVGASNLATILAQSTPAGLEVRVPALQLLLGGLPDEVPEVTLLASPVEHVDGRDPPLLILHGDQDATIPVNQALELEAAYRRAGLTAELMIINGVGHVARPFFTGPATDRAVEFLHRTIGR